ncbi:DUF6252 family protein [Aureibaculum sp. 2210JD6-5]|uniref:DUF6252 family protein n=1 Tax=Aureibaculum sp. 2210JD6-5 TaxID=3103957 RepID=UPI002AADD049|nr:DUF6252 family protein [Aureibaculum sp. 2210JD6-5]MDY7395663.1 DUF6252 family protein [Aureibaculum sp. 2210JD6-5]
MKNTKCPLLKSHLLLVFILIIITTSCSIDDVVPDDILGGGNITATINGNKFESAKEYDKVEITSISNIYIIALSAGDAEGISKLKGLVLVASGEDYATLKSGKTWNEPGISNEVNKARAAYSEDDGSSETNDFDTEITEDIYIKITSLDKSKKTISGEFTFTVVDEDTGKKYKATNGKFKEIPYTLTEQ